MFKTATKVIGRINHKLENINDRLYNLDHDASDAYHDLAFRKKLYELRKQFPYQVGALLDNELLRNKFDSFRHWRCLWLMRDNEYYAKSADECLDELCALYGNTCDECKESFVKLSNEIGYELKISAKMPCQPHVAIKQVRGLDGWAHGWDISWKRYEKVRCRDDE